MAAAMPRTTRRTGRPLMLFVVNDTEFFASHRLPLAIAARRQGYEVHLAAHPEGQLDLLARHAIVFHPLPVDRTGVNVWHELRLVLRLAALLRALRPRIVHCVTVKPVLYGGLLARLLRIEGYVAAVSGLGQVFLADGPATRVLCGVVRRLYKVALGHRNGRVIFQNPDDQAEFVSAGLVRKEQTVLIRGAGVEPQDFGNGLAPDDGRPMILLPARLLWAKGVGEFVAAARALKAGGCPARFVIAGAAPAHNRASVPEATLRAWHEEGSIEWLGHRGDMPALYAASTIVCLPSWYREGVPRCLIEAAACGRPIVTTTMPGCREICRDGENGLLVPPRDVAALTAALARLLGDRQLRLAMGRRGRLLVEREFSLGKVVAATLEIYDALAATPAGPAAALPGPAGLGAVR
ncbi:glycosyltransferase family 4 protein [Rhodospirillales bacterium YIM 152171]|uniref:Glycosyltransferase family 4 protein n=2 Tax=Marinimicrococcus flavescens TaxID=3031815 RepID=A0AAP3UYL7_9PROT|nr:glycosyltransferase family 4 protein [Marinimicrococcus flavescens]